MTDFERIKILTGERDEELVEVVLEERQTGCWRIPDERR